MFEFLCRVNACALCEFTHGRLDCDGVAAEGLRFCEFRQGPASGSFGFHERDDSSIQATVSPDESPHVFTMRR